MIGECTQFYCLTFIQQTMKEEGLNWFGVDLTGYKSNFKSPARLCGGDIQVCIHSAIKFLERKQKQGNYRNNHRQSSNVLQCYFSCTTLSGLKVSTFSFTCLPGSAYPCVFLIDLHVFQETTARWVLCNTHCLSPFRDIYSYFHFFHPRCLLVKEKHID